MSYKRVLTMQDISCIGQCSLTVALPILSACGHETCVLPSAVLSTHTGGFKDYHIRDLSNDIPLIINHWQKEKIRFDAVYSGYLGSVDQIGYLQDIYRRFGDGNVVKILDPAMADNGKLYAGFDEGYVKAMGKAIAGADYVLPNITEACMLTQTEYRTDYDENFIIELVNKLRAMGPENIILTGVKYAEDTTGVLIYEKGTCSYYKHRLIGKGCHGTGDIFASSFTGALLRGRTAYEAAVIAADYTVGCIENTIGDPKHWYGVKFEEMLPSLIKSLNS